MATSSQIKSAIRSRGTAQREITQQLAGVSEQLLKAEESARLNEFKAKEEGRGFDTAFKGFETISILSEDLKQKKQIEKDIETFKTSLGEDVSEFRIDKSDISLMDVFKQKNTLTEFLSQEDKYFLGNKELGSKYDVAAKGQQIESLSLVKNLLESTDSPLLKSSEINLETPKSPSINKKVPMSERIYNEKGGLESPKKVKPKSTKSLTNDIFENIVISDKKADEMGFNIPDITDEDSSLISFLGDPDLSIEDFKKFADLGFPLSDYGQAE